MYLTFSCLKIPAKRVLIYPKGEDALGRRGLPTARYKIFNDETGKWVYCDRPAGEKVVTRLAKNAGFKKGILPIINLIVTDEENPYVRVFYLRT